MTEPTFWWDDFDSEDADDVPGKHALTIYRGVPGDLMSDEVAVIVHRDCGGKYPLDGDVAATKRLNAQQIVDALNLKAECDSGRYSIKDNETGEWLA